MNHTRLHNPKYVGPGIWFSMHIMAYNAKTQKEKEFVVKQIRIIQENFPCQECKSHFWTYLENHPPESAAASKSDPEALFLWTVNFHNAVNFRKGYNQLSLEEAKSLYSGDSLYCSKASCEDEASENEVIEDKPVALKSPKRDKTYESKDSKPIVGINNNSKSKSVSLMPSDMLCVKKNLR
jgi:hypothetical protein